MEKRKVKDIQLLFGLVVVMSIFNLLSMQVYMGGFEFENSDKKLESNNPEVPSQTNTAAVKTESKKSNSNSEAKSNNVIDSFRNLFGNKAKQETNSDSVNDDSQADQQDIEDQTPVNQQNNNQQNSNQQNNNQQNSNQQNDNQQNNNQNNDNSNNQNGNSQNDNSQNDDQNNQGNDDGADSPLDDYVPPNDNGPPAESVEGKNLQFRFGSGLG